MKRNFIKCASLSLLVLITVSLSAQQIQPLPIDPKVRYGKLDNGLTYYIRANKEPKQRAEFYIAQNVGAILENDDQNGLAHFLEHMAFKGTKNFPGKTIIEYLEKLGVKFGADINAQTNLDGTVYNLSDVPTVREGVVDSTLLILHDWSNFISLKDTAIDSERGVIREEWRFRAGANSRLLKESTKQKYPGSQYAKRDVIGDTAIINHFKHETIRDFYKKWYRPDLQAIVIVGDIDVDKVEAKIKKLFNDIPKKENPAERTIYTITDNQQPIVSVVKDLEARATQVDLEYKHKVLPAEIKLSINGFAHNVMNSLIGFIMSYRFNEIIQQADAPFVYADAMYLGLFKSTDAFKFRAIAKEGKELEGLNAILLEAEKTKRFGFTNSELERAKTDFLKIYEKTYNERDNQKNNQLVQAYVGNFLNQNPISGIEWEYTSVQMMLPQLKLEEINQLVKSYITDTNMIVSIMAPDKEAVKTPTEAQIHTAIENAKKAELTAKVEETNSKQLIEKIPAAGTISKITQNKSLGTTEWKLSNGVRVVFKPTTFKKDEILFTAYSEGGLSKIKNVADLPSGIAAPNVVLNNGLGDYNQVELGKILTGKMATVSTYINTYEEGLSGNSSVSNFDTMLQLAYLIFTAPRKDDNAFKALKNSYQMVLSNIASDPHKSFSDSIEVAVSNHNPRTILFNLEVLDKIDQDKSFTIFKERFSVPANFTFVFTGNIDPNNDVVKNFICTYLGGLKSVRGGEKFTDNNIRSPKGKVNNYFAKEMQIKKASNYIQYTASIPYNLSNDIVIRAIGDILTLRYTESIREKEGASYTIQASGSLGKIPVEEATLKIQFETDPVKQEKMKSIVYSEISKIIDKGPLAEDLQKVKENMLKKYTEDLTENGWWQNAVTTFYKNNINLVYDYKTTVEALTSEKIQTALKNIVSQENVLDLVMKPVE